MQGVIMHETHNAHDEHDEMQHDAKMKCNGPNKSHDETRKPWKASEAPVLGRYMGTWYVLTCA